jgi:hypothetical protein
MNARDGSVSYMDRNEWLGGHPMLHVVLSRRFRDSAPGGRGIRLCKDFIF